MSRDDFMNELERGIKNAENIPRLPQLFHVVIGQDFRMLRLNSSQPQLEIAPNERAISLMLDGMENNPVKAVSVADGYSCLNCLRDKDRNPVKYLRNGSELSFKALHRLGIM